MIHTKHKAKQQLPFLNSATMFESPFGGVLLDGLWSHLGHITHNMSETSPFFQQFSCLQVLQICCCFWVWPWDYPACFQEHTAYSIYRMIMCIYIYIYIYRYICIYIYIHIYICIYIPPGRVCRPKGFFRGFI